jgi:hypothetical protein
VLYTYFDVTGLCAMAICEAQTTAPINRSRNHAAAFSHGRAEYADSISATA